MKKLTSISLVVVLVLALGSLVFANEGPLGTLTAEINVSAKIGPYAKVTPGNPVDFGTLLGKVGLYTANGLDGMPGNEFYDRAAEMFGNPTLADNFDENMDNSTGHGNFWVEANTDVNVAIGFAPTNWLNSKTLFAVAKSGHPQIPLAWTSANFTLPAGTATSFEHQYQKGNIYYGIDGAIWIESISQQYAKNYSGVITITVSK